MFGDLSCGNKRKKLRIVVKIILFGCFVCCLGVVPSGCLVVYPGPVMDLCDVLEVSEYPPKEHSFYMVSVLAQDASVLECIIAAVDSETGLWTKSQVFGGMQPEDYAKKSREAMEESQRIATYVALRASGVEVSDEYDLPIRVSSYTGDVAGPSAGLAFALEVLNRLGDDMIQARKIACTGVLDRDGRVSAVGGIAQKTIACERMGIDIFLVPKENYDEAARLAHDLMVVGVSTFQEAIAVVTYGVNP